jgi:hypothetical protein
MLAGGYFPFVDNLRRHQSERLKELEIENRAKDEYIQSRLPVLLEEKFDFQKVFDRRPSKEKIAWMKERCKNMPLCGPIGAGLADDLNLQMAKRQSEAGFNEMEYNNVMKKRAAEIESIDRQPDVDDVVYHVMNNPHMYEKSIGNNDSRNIVHDPYHHFNTRWQLKSPTAPPGQLVLPFPGTNQVPTLAAITKYPKTMISQKRDSLTAYLIIAEVKRNADNKFFEFHGRPRPPIDFAALKRRPEEYQRPQRPPHLPERIRPPPGFEHLGCRRRISPLPKPIPTPPGFEHLCHLQGLPPQPQASGAPQNLAPKPQPIGYPPRLPPGFEPTDDPQMLPAQPIGPPGFPPKPQPIRYPRNTPLSQPIGLPPQKLPPKLQPVRPRPGFPTEAPHVAPLPPQQLPPKPKPKRRTWLTEMN